MPGQSASVIVECVCGGSRNPASDVNPSSGDIEQIGRSGDSDSQIPLGVDPYALHIAAGGEFNRASGSACDDVQVGSGGFDIGFAGLNDAARRRQGTENTHLYLIRQI